VNSGPTRGPSPCVPGHILNDQAFLAKYYDPAANGGKGGWIYPPDNGYVIGPDGQPIETHLTMYPGQDMDRFGSEYGAFLAPNSCPTPCAPSRRRTSTGIRPPGATTTTTGC
jgi:hypothetical protein